MEQASPPGSIPRTANQGVGPNYARHLFKPPQNLLRSIETTLYAGIDYNFRPDSYRTASANPLEAMLRNMKGRRRREMVRDIYAAGKLEELSNILLSDSLDDEARKRLGQIHPTFMGG